MRLSLKLVPAMALAVTLAPFAAQAQAASQPALQHHAYADTHNVSEVMVGSSTVDAPTHVYSNDVFPDSFGG